jgi:effector-binding domain-containing protein
VQPRPIAAVRVTTEITQWPGQFKAALDQVYAAAKAGKVRLNGVNVMVYRPRSDGLCDIDCGVETVSEFEPAGAVVYCETPRGEAAAIAHIGPYRDLRLSHDAVVKWCREHDRSRSGVVWEVYGHWNNNPATVRTDLFHLLDSETRQPSHFLPEDHGRTE